MLCLLSSKRVYFVCAYCVALALPLTSQAKDGLDRGGLEQLFSFPSLELGLSRTEAEVWP